MNGPTPTCPRCMHTAHLPGPCTTPSEAGCRECESEPTPTEKGQPADELLEYLAAHPERDYTPTMEEGKQALRQLREASRTSAPQVEHAAQLHRLDMALMRIRYNQARIRHEHHHL